MVREGFQVESGDEVQTVQIVSSKRLPWLRLAAILVALFVVTTVAAGQTMSFSLYVDPWFSTGPMLNVYSNVSDNSSGCSHGNYFTTVRLFSPSGRQASNSSPGLSVSISLATNEEYGDWTVVATGNYYCSCFGGNGAFGCSTSGNLSFSQGNYFEIFHDPIFNYEVCLGETVRCPQMHIFEEQLPEGVSEFPPYLRIATMNLELITGGAICYALSTLVIESCDQEF